MKRVFQRLRRYLVTGLVVIAPIGVTVFVLTWLFRSLDPIIGRHLPPIAGLEPRGLGLLAPLIILVVVGWASQRALGRRVLRAWNRFASRVPVGGICRPDPETNHDVPIWRTQNSAGMGHRSSTWLFWARINSRYQYALSFTVRCWVS